MLGYCRTPSLSRGRVLFSCAEDIWEVPVAGGRAKRLVGGPGLKTRPFLSPDGTRLSYTSNERGPSEIFVAEASGTAPRRATWLGSVSRNLGWRGDELLFVSQAGLPHQSAFQLFTARDGVAAPVGWGPVGSIAFHADGTCALGRHEIVEYTTRKGYRGGARGELWLDDRGDGNFRRLLDLPGSLTRPCWVGERVFFLSDHEGQGNVYSCARDGTDLRRHTTHEGFFPRHLSSDGGSLVYSRGGDLYALDPAAGGARRLDVEVPLDPPRPISVALKNYLEDFDYSPAERKLALVSRGRGFLFDQRGLRELGAFDGSRVRLLRWLPGSLGLVGIRSDGLRETLVVFTGAGSSAGVAAADFGHAIQLRVHPAGRQVAIANDRFELFVIDLKTGRAELVEKSEFGEISGLDWSPGGERLAYSCPVSAESSVIRVFSVAGSARCDAAPAMLRDFCAAFAGADKPYLYFLSERYAQPAANGTGGSVCVMARPLRAFLGKDGVEGVEALPVPEGKYRNLVAVGGRIFYSCSSRGEKATEVSQQLFAFDPVAGKETLLAEGVAEFHADSGGVAFRSGTGYFAVEGDACVPILDVKDVRLEVEPALEWPQMFDEAWRGQRDQYWSAGMGGVDWEAVRARYRPLLGRIGARSEYSDIVWEMLGELRTSHAYEGYADLESRPYDDLGFLGADLSPVGGGYEVRRILRDEVWEEGIGSPLAAPGLGILPGDTLVGFDPAALRDSAGREIPLRVRGREGERTVPVKPLRSELVLRYRDWLLEARALVARLSGGRCGYVHLPHTRADAFADFHRQFLSQCAKPALVIDARNSSGGHTGEFVLDRLVRKPLGSVRTRYGRPYSFPPSPPPAALALLVNEYTGSDSEVFARAFRMLGLGPLVGKVTWGGVYGLKQRFRSLDGGYTTRPQTAFRVGAEIENLGVEPDVVVESAPQDHAAGRDPQLERAVAEALARLGAEA